MKRNFIILLTVMYTSISAQHLDSLLVWSTKNHPGLKSSYLSYKASLEAINGAGFLPEPMFSFGYFIQPVETRLGPQRGSVGFQQMFPWRGTLRAQKSMAVSQSKMKFEQFQLEKIKLYQIVKENFYEANRLQVSMGLISDNIMLLEQIKTIGLSKIEAGEGSTTDILRLNLKITEMRSNLSTAQIQFSGKVGVLELLTGKEIVELQFEKNSIANQIVSQGDSLVHHPMVAMVEEKLKSNAAQQKVIQQMALPKLGFGMNYVAVGERTDMNPAGNGNDVLMSNISLTLPIYRKKYKALSKMNTLERESIEEEVKDAELRLQSKLVMVRAQIEVALERISFFEDQSQTAQAILQILRSDYENGTANIESIFTTQGQLIQYQLETQKAVTSLQIARSNLAFILNQEI